MPAPPSAKPDSGHSQVSTTPDMDGSQSGSPAHIGRPWSPSVIYLCTHHPSPVQKIFQKNPIFLFLTGSV